MRHWIEINRAPVLTLWGEHAKLWGALASRANLGGS